MEISGFVLRSNPAVSGLLPLPDSTAVGTPSPPSTVVAFVSTTRASARLRGLSASFSDAEYLKFYTLPVRCGGGRSKEEKKRAKLLKRLSEDLDGLAGDGKRKEITKAGELLMAELNRLRAQERERRKKKKVAKKASKRKGCAALDSSSSSESSDDDECGSKVLRMSNLRTTPLHEFDPETPQIAIPTPKTEEVANQPITVCKNAAAATEIERSSSKVCCSSSFTGTTSALEMPPMEKIEVCMGRKCRMSGAAELMEEFGRKVGREGAVVVGCKCMGKCRDGPNVRISAATGEPKNRLCIGVGVEDVGTIVANFFGEKDAGQPLPAA